MSSSDERLDSPQRKLEVAVYRQAAKFNFCGPEYEQVIAPKVVVPMARATAARVTRWLQSPTLFRKIHLDRVHRPLREHVAIEVLHRQQQLDLANETVTKGSGAFIATNFKRWQPDGGLSLRAWFENGCLMVFNDTWGVTAWREIVTWNLVARLDDPVVAARAGNVAGVVANSADPADTVVMRDLISRFSRSLDADPRVAALAAYRLAGLTAAEIREAMDITHTQLKALESRLARRRESFTKNDQAISKETGR